MELVDSRIEGSKIAVCSNREKKEEIWKNANSRHSEGNKLREKNQFKTWFLFSNSFDNTVWAEFPYFIIHAFKIKRCIDEKAPLKRVFDTI